MKILKKIILIIGGIIVFLLAIILVWTFTSGPTLPPGANEIIEQVIQAELPEIIKGDTGFVKSGDVDIWYESLQPEGTKKGAILLIMGISNDAISWPEYFYQPMVDSGYQVIRYDHRGTGMSDWLKDWDRKNPYTLDDMAYDGIAIMDELEVDQVHVIGLSMGGMIAQQMVINHSERILSLTSIMSSGYIEDPELPGISKYVLKEIIKSGIRYGIVNTEINTIKLNLAVRKLLMGDSIYRLDVKSVSEQVLYNIRKRKGYNAKVSPQHSTAVSVSGSRYEDMKNIKLPTLIIHGRSDPFVPFEHGEKCARLIPGAKTFWVDGMGHDIPEMFSDTILKVIFENINLKYSDKLLNTR